MPLVRIHQRFIRLGIGTASVGGALSGSELEEQTVAGMGRVSGEAFWALPRFYQSLKPTKRERETGNREVSCIPRGNPSHLPSLLGNRKISEVRGCP